MAVIFSFAGPNEPEPTAGVPAATTPISAPPTPDADAEAAAKAEKQAKAEADKKAQAEADKKAQAEADQKAKEEADRKAKEQAQGKYGNQPKDQTAFVRAVVMAQEKGAEADNDLKLGSALSRRNNSICKLLPGSGKVEGWRGKIRDLDANGDGKGIVQIEIAPDVQVSTWNNAFSDANDRTLIEHGKLFDRLLEMETGQMVTFDGRFIEGGSDCVNDSRLTLRGRVAHPHFIFKFSTVK